MIISPTPTLVKINGGALYVSGVEVTVMIDTYFSESRAGVNGGAVHVAVTVRNTISCGLRWSLPRKVCYTIVEAHSKWPEV